MDYSHRLVVAASLALALGGAAQAADPAPNPSDNPATPAVKELPSRPFPKVLLPPETLPKADSMAVAPGQPVDQLAATETRAVPKPAAKPRPKVAAKAPADPALQQVVHDAVQTDGHGQAAERAPYLVQPRDTLDRVIRKTLPTSPFSPQILREAYIKANPQVFQGGRALGLRIGQTLRIPDAGVFRLVVLGETSAPGAGNPASAQSSETAAAGRGPVLSPTALPDSPKIAGPLAVPAAMPAPPVLSIPRQPVDVLTAAGPSSSVSPEEKKKWVRFP